MEKNEIRVETKVLRYIEERYPDAKSIIREVLNKTYLEALGVYREELVEKGVNIELLKSDLFNYDLPERYGDFK